MRHRKLSAACLLVMYLLIPILSVLMIHHVTVSEILSNMDSGGFGEDYGMFSVTSEDITPADVYATAQNLNASYALYTDYVTEDNTVVRYLYFNQTYAKLSMKWGRFFKASDFSPENAFAVIGKGMEDQLYYKDITPYISVDGTEYQVIGIIGYDCKTVFDQYILVNGYLCNRTDFHSYTIDFFQVSNAADSLNHFISQLQSDGIEAHTQVVSERFVNSILPKVLYSRWFLLLLICDIACIILLTMEWLSTWRQEIAIRRLIGGENSQMIALIAGRYFIMYFSSLMIGCIYTLINYPAYITNLLTGYLLLFAAAAIFLTLHLNRLLHQPIAEEVA